MYRFSITFYVDGEYFRENVVALDDNDAMRKMYEVWPDLSLVTCAMIG